MKKIILAAIMILAIATSLFAGLFEGFFPDLKIIATEHFDIYFLDQSEDLARELAYVADGYYEELKSSLNPETDQRIPVIITPYLEPMDAYYTPSPRSAIVLYDTLIQDGVFEISRTNLLNVFYHELTHALSLTNETPFFKTVTALMGDYYNLPTLYLYPFFIEGVTVDYESHNGGGRLNSGFVTDILIQAKHEGVFPQWTEVAGSRDTAPAGELKYYFGGAFSDYLEKTYGRETYNQLFTESAKARHWLVGELLFKDVFGLTLDQGWEDFEASIKVPENMAEPASFDPMDGSFCNLSAFDGKLAYVEQYSKTAFIDHKPTLTASGYNPSFSIRADGAYMTTVLMTEDRSYGKVLDASGNPVFNIEGAQGLVALDEVVLSLERNGSTAILRTYGYDGSMRSEKVLERPLQAYQLTGLDNGRSCFIYDNSIYILDSGLSIVDTIALPEEYEFTDLSFSDGRIIMAYAGDLPRLAILDLGTRELRLSTNSFSGGIHEPVIIKDKVYFVSQFYSRSQLSLADLSSFSFLDPAALPAYKAPEPFGRSALESKDAKYMNFKSLPVVLPFSLADSCVLGLSVLYGDLTSDWEGWFTYGYSGLTGNVIELYASNASLPVHFMFKDTLYANIPGNNLSLQASYEGDLGQSFFGYGLAGGLTFSNSPGYSYAGIRLMGGAGNQHYYKRSMFSMTGFNAQVTLGAFTAKMTTRRSSLGLTLRGEYSFKDLLETDPMNPLFFGLPLTAYGRISIDPGFSTGFGVRSTLLGYEIQDSLHFARIYFNRAMLDAELGFDTDFSTSFAVYGSLTARLAFAVVYGRFASSINYFNMSLSFASGSGVSFDVGLDMGF
ncbi:MAG: hypothetical protein PHI83_05545 [Sphaerochaetaceae bacterium]|nr:hypothetical protein [Sphaerochaetaceae bacterium]